MCPRQSYGATQASLTRVVIYRNHRSMQYAPLYIAPTQMSICSLRQRIARACTCLAASPHHYHQLQPASTFRQRTADLPRLQSDPTQLVGNLNSDIRAGTILPLQSWPEGGNIMVGRSHYILQVRPAPCPYPAPVTHTSPPPPTLQQDDHVNADRGRTARHTCCHDNSSSNEPHHRFELESR